MNDSQTVLETIDLGRDFAGRIAVKEVSLTAGRGEIVALLGPNGVGKSTLMKLIAGLLMPSNGQARLWGQSSWPPSREMHRVACVLDGMSPPSGARVMDIIALKSCVTKSFDRAYAKLLCDEHRIALTSRWHTLSKGQKRWVLLVTALASGSDLLLLDEPADGLDVATRRELYKLLREQTNQRGATVVLASHIIADVEQVADDVVILVDARVRLHAPLEQLREEVCEVEFRGDTSLSAIAPYAEVISCHFTGHGVLGVIRFRSEHLSEQPLPGETNRRRISLEELYLAYTQPKSVNDMGEAIMETTMTS